ncbi:hypothetical protein MTP99_018460 [Tenebrio molitor]|jgi:hypothetical protein|nr:hypothetical protein MTP99_018460 [Tenebrio molitor]
MRGREEKSQVEEADWMKRMKMIEEKMEQREKKERKNNVIITAVLRENIERGVDEWLERIDDAGKNRKLRVEEPHYAR